MPNRETWRCTACGCTRDEADRLRRSAGAPPLDPDAVACGQACALLLVEHEIAAAEALLRDRGSTAMHVEASSEEDASSGDARLHLPRRAAYLHVLSRSSLAARPFEGGASAGAPPDA
jgi:hypothetical protein